MTLRSRYWSIKNVEEKYHHKEWCKPSKMLIWYTRLVCKVVCTTNCNTNHTFIEDQIPKRWQVCVRYFLHMQLNNYTKPTAPDNGRCKDQDAAYCRCKPCSGIKFVRWEIKRLEDRFTLVGTPECYHLQHLQEVPAARRHPPQGPPVDGRLWAGRRYSAPLGRAYGRGTGLRFRAGVWATRVIARLKNDLSDQKGRVIKKKKR